MRLFWVVTPVSYLHPEISYQHSDGFDVDTAKKPVIARVLASFLSLLKTPIWYERYEKYEIPLDY